MFDTRSTSSSNKPALFLGAALVLALIALVYFWSKSEPKPTEPSAKQSELAPMQEPQVATSARDTLVLALHDKWTPNGFIVEFRYSQPAEGPTMLLGVTLVAQTGERKAVASDKNWFDRFAQALDMGQKPAPRRHPPRSAIA